MRDGTGTVGSLHGGDDAWHVQGKELTNPLTLNMRKRKEKKFDGLMVTEGSDNDESGLH